MTDPDFVYDQSDWESTYPWEDRGLLAYNLEVGEIKQFSTLIHGPEKWCAKIGTDFDEDGDPGDWEYHWFDNEDEARAALAHARGEK